MKKAENIQQELTSLASELLISHISTPYLVPFAYFEALPSALLQVSKTQASNTTMLPEPSQEQTFELPVAYFENFATTLLANIKAQQEDVAVSLPTLPNPYSIPNKQYFETFPQEILSSINTTEPVLSVGKIATPFELPNAGYFESNVATLVTVAQNTEIDINTAAPILSAISKKIPFEVPQHYFDNFKVATEKPAAKTVIFESKKKTSILKKWSIAAAIALLVSYGANTLVFNNQAIDDSNPAALNINSLIASISKESIDEYINVNLEDFELTNMSTATNTVAPNDLILQQMKDNISKEELDQYLQIVE